MAVNPNENGGDIISTDPAKDIVHFFEVFSKHMVSDLNEFADLLTSPKLKTYDIAWGKAEIADPHNDAGKIIYSFLHNGPIFNVGRQRDECEVVHAQFDFRGRLNYFGWTCREPVSFWFAKADFGSNGEAPGQLDSFSGIINNRSQFFFSRDPTGQLHFRLNRLEKLVHQNI